ncbi:MAG: beta-glucosidase, partial [Lachnospiraceae bacterium]|nr:beta-glucosidase [Lachnospiraceae bacterium]
AWKDFMRDGKYRNVILDTHQYLMMVEAFGLEPTKEGYVQFIEEHFAKDVAEMQQYFPVICGEWCLSNAISYRKFTDAVTKEERGCTKEERDEIMRALDRAQKAAWDKGSGYFYWSWKLHIDTALRPESEGTEPWDLGRAALYGWFEPEK